MTSKIISSTIENFTKVSVFNDLKKGDPKWDIPHAKAVVHHIKKIIKNSPKLKLDSTVLIIAAYGHDWGYSKYYVSGRSMTKEEYMTAKKTHAEIGAKKMEGLLKNSVYDSLNEKQKMRIIYLILNHDPVDLIPTLQDHDQIILMEADTLGGIDTDFVTSTWTKEQDIKHLNDARAKRFPYFISDYSKNKFAECYLNRLKVLT